MFRYPSPVARVAAVEEAVEDIIADSAAKSTEAKTSTDCVLGETVAKSKSPKYLPKFLRTSFSKLISKSTDKTKSQSSSQEPLSLPFFSSVSVPSLSSPTASQGADTAAPSPDPRPCSPATQQFVEDSLARGFPLIPFHYTSLDIVERGRARHRSKEKC